MEKQRIFRQYQEHVVDDHNKAQEFARAAIDHVTRDGVTAARRYAGFNAVKTAQTEVTVSAGRMYGPNDAADGTAVYVRATSLVQSMTTHLAAASKRIVSLSVYGGENEIDIETRDFAVIANPDEPLEVGQQVPIQPDAVAMTRSRDAVLVFTQGAEGADPQPPAIPATHVEIARILLDTIQVVSIAMMTDNEVTSTDALDKRADALETFKNQIDPRVSSLASDLASLQEQLARIGSPTRIITMLVEDMARVKERVSIPEDATDYHADRFLTPLKSDVEDDEELGFDAKVEEGIRFADANADEFEIALFSNNDPNAAVSNGVLLPKHTSELKLSTGPYHSDIGIAQFGFQTVEMKVGYMSRERLRYGGSYSVCTNGSYWATAGEPPPAANLYDFETWELVQVNAAWAGNLDHLYMRTDSFWFDSWKEPYIYAQTVDHEIVGALVAQSVLVANDMWATRLAFHLIEKAANESVHLTLCEVTNGTPNPERAVAYVAVPHADLVVGKNLVAIPSTFLRGGKRYAVIVMSNANHRFGLSDGQNYLDGTFFTSTDGAYFLGDLTKDLMIEIWGAKFDAPQVVIEFQPINLDGGFRDIDILAETIKPASTELVYEIRPGGAGAWLALTRDNLAALTGAPVLAQFRARFIGTTDMMPALRMTGSRVHVSRPKTAFKHVSIPLTFASATEDVVIKLIAEGFDETPHNLTCTLRHGVTDESPDATVTKALPDLPEVTGRIERTFTFNWTGAVSEVTIVIEGATNSAANVFHVSERVDYAL